MIREVKGKITFLTPENDADWDELFRLYDEDNLDVGTNEKRSASRTQAAREELERKIALGIREAESGRVAPLNIEDIKARARRRLRELRKDGSHE